VLQTLHRELGLGQQLDVLQQPPRRQRAGAALFHRGGAGGGERDVQVGGGQLQTAFRGGLGQDVGQDRHGRLALDRTLQEQEFLQQDGFLYREFHGHVPVGRRDG